MYLATHLDAVIQRARVNGYGLSFINPMARVIVFGAAGQVGVSLAETALRDGYQVTAFIRNTPLPGHLTDKVCS